MLCGPLDPPGLAGFGGTQAQLCGVPRAPPRSPGPPPFSLVHSCSLTRQHWQSGGVWCHVTPPVAQSWGQSCPLAPPCCRHLPGTQGAAQDGDLEVSLGHCWGGHTVSPSLPLWGGPQVTQGLGIPPCYHSLFSTAVTLHLVGCTHVSQYPPPPGLPAPHFTMGGSARASPWVGVPKTPLAQQGGPSVISGFEAGVSSNPPGVALHPGGARWGLWGERPPVLQCWGCSIHGGTAGDTVPAWPWWLSPWGSSAGKGKGEFRGGEAGVGRGVQG